MKAPSVPVRIMAAALVLATALVGLVVREGMARAQGQEARLAITGYDPRSLLTGHYVQFRFQDQAPGGRCPASMARVSDPPLAWVALRRAGDRHMAVEMAPTREAALRLGELAVRGEATCSQDVTILPGDRRVETQSIWLDIGPDRLHLDQTQAQRMERALRQTPGAPAFAVVSVGRDGKARLKGLIVGGQRADLDWF